jgi:hypothetical protein
MARISGHLDSFMRDAGNEVTVVVRASIHIYQDQEQQVSSSLIAQPTSRV